MTEENDPNAKTNGNGAASDPGAQDRAATGEPQDDRQNQAAQSQAALEKENAELKDQMLRLVAEMDNLRKRTEREIKDGRTYAIANFARDMLVATDNLSRALMVVSAEARQNADDTTKSLIEGIEMTEREMLRLLQKNGITPIEAEGVKFDPHKHQAMFDVPNPDVPEGTIVQVMQTGFAIGDRVLRPAMVGVAKGGPKQAPLNEGANPARPDPGQNAETANQSENGADTGARYDREV